jgi:hypothetical protein
VRTKQKVVIKNDEVVNLGADEDDCIIQLSCGSMLIVDTKIIKRLVGILEGEGKIKETRDSSI